MFQMYVPVLIEMHHTCDISYTAYSKEHRTLSYMNHLEKQFIFMYTCVLFPELD